MMFGSWVRPGIFTLAVSGLLSMARSEVTVSHLRTTALGTDPEGSARLNGLSFQQDPLTSFNGWYDPALSPLGVFLVRSGMAERI